MVTSFFEAIAWFIPLVGIILAIYFPATQNLNGEQNGERSRDYPQFKCSSNLKNADGCGTKIWTGYMHIIDLEGQPFDLARNY